jgi:hypothetical protein
MKPSQEIYESSLALPPASDMIGEILLCAERGPQPQICAWRATYGETGAVWVPLGDSFTGVMANCPAATDVRTGATVFLTDLGVRAMPGDTSYTNVGGRLRSNGTRWVPAPGMSVVLVEIYATAATPWGSSGAGSVANLGSTDITHAAGAVPTIGPNIIQSGSILRHELLSKRIAGTTSSAGLLAGVMANSQFMFGASFSAAGAAAEAPADGQTIITGDTTFTGRAYQLFGVQNVGSYTDVTSMSPNVRTTGLQLKCVKFNNTGSANTDNLGMHFWRTTLIG